MDALDDVSGNSCESTREDLPQQAARTITRALGRLDVSSAVIEASDAMGVRGVLLSLSESGSMQDSQHHLGPNR